MQERLLTSAVDLYRGELLVARGFRELQDDPFRLWLPIKVIRAMSAAEGSGTHPVA